MSVQKDSVTDKQTCMIDLLSITDAPVIMMNDPHTESVTSKKKAENNRGHVFNSQEEQCPKPALNHSLSSASSASSQRSFSERVKISSKHLKEIKSPFDTNGNLKTSDKVDLSNEFRVSKPHKEKDKNEANRLNEKSLPPTRSNQHQPRQEKIGLLTNDSVNISIIKHTAAGEEQTTIKNRSSSPLSITSVHAESCKDTSHGSMSNASRGSSQPEIITVKTVSAVPSLSSTPSVSMMETPLPRALKHPNKTTQQQQQGSLKQGHVCNILQVTEQQEELGDVKIAQFSLDDKHKLLKDNFFKRKKQGGPVKRTVQPHVIHRVKEVKKEEVASPAPAPAVDPYTTTAIAVSTALEATKPFLKAQFELESRMVEIVERLSVIQGQQSQSAEQSTENKKPNADNERLVSLEKQVSQMTEKRLDQLERLQEQQMHWQANLMSMYQGKPATQISPPNVSNGLQSQEARKPNYMTAYAEPGARTSGGSAVSTSLLDTPAPRRRPPPAPTSYDVNLDVNDYTHQSASSQRRIPRNAGFMEEVMSGKYDQNGSLIKSAETRQDVPAPRRQTQALRSASESTITVRDSYKEANHPQQQTDGHKEQAMNQSAKFASLKQFIPTPFDEYLMKPKNVIGSPYPAMKDKTATVTPIVNNFADIKQILKQIRTHKSTLEHNLAFIMKNHQDADFLSLICDDISKDSSLADRIRLRKMVDAYITDMNAELEEEILDEMKKMQKEQLRFEVPVRDTNRTKPTSSTGSKNPPSKLSVKQTEKGITSTKTKAKPSAKPIIQKKMQQNRNINLQKSFQTSTIQTKSIPPVQKEYSIGQRVIHNQQQQVSAPGRPVFLPTPVAAQPKSEMFGGGQVSTAIPLGAPRIEDSQKVNVMKLKSKKTLAKSSPVHAKKIEPAHEIDLKNETVKKNVDNKHKYSPQNLHIQVLPGVDIEADASAAVIDLIEPCDHDQSKILSPGITDDHQNIELQNETGVDKDDEYGEGISLPGYSAPSQQYHGPSFPPKMQPIKSPPSSDVLATDLHRRDIVENKAVEWIEQELMAVLISDAYKNAQVNQPQPAVVNNQNPPLDVSDDSFQEQGATLDHLGQDGMQIFVDAGQPVDEKLFATLLRECLAERIASTLGESRNSSLVRKTPAKMEALPPMLAEAPRISSPEVPTTDKARSVRVYEVSTPVPTPSHSPPASPAPQMALSPPPTPDMTPTASIAEPSTTSKLAFNALETDAGEDSLHEHEMAAYHNKMTDIHREETILSGAKSDIMSGAKSDTVIMSSLEPRYDVVTPTVTPPPSLPKPSPPRTPPTPTLSSVEPSEEAEIVEKAAAEEEMETASSSPQPWADPQSVMSEANPNYEEHHKISTMPKMKEYPDVLKQKPNLTPKDVAVDTEDLKPEPAPPSPSPSHESSSPSTDVSETINECVSDGQWLVQKSLGELGALAYEEVMCEKMKAHHGKGTNNDDSVASTLHSTDELEDEATDAGRSEGQFIHGHIKNLENDPILALLSKMQKQPASHLQTNAYSDDAHFDRTVANRSMGEISVGQVFGTQHRGAYETNGDSEGLVRSPALNRDGAASGPRPAPRARVIQVGGTLCGSSPQRPASHAKPPVPSLNNTLQGSKDTMANLTGVFGTNSFSLDDVDSDRQSEGDKPLTLKPVDMDQLLNPVYMSQSFSTDADAVNLGQSGYSLQDTKSSHGFSLSGTMQNQFGFTQTLERSQNFTETNSLGQTGSLNQSVSLNLSADDLSQTNGSFDRPDDNGKLMGVTRLVSVTMPTTNISESDEGGQESIEDVSEISLGNV